METPGLLACGLLAIRAGDGSLPTGRGGSEPAINPLSGDAAGYGVPKDHGRSQRAADERAKSVGRPDNNRSLNRVVLATGVAAHVR